MTVPRSTKRLQTGRPSRRKNGDTPLLQRLNIATVAQHLDDLRLFFLIGFFFRQAGAKSLRGCVRMLRAGPAGWPEGELAVRVADGLPRSLRAVHKAVAVLENLVGQRLAKRTGEGLSYDGCTEFGEKFWAETEDFLRKYWR